MMGMVVFSGHQPNFLPYMGYFYKMYRSDVFVLDDDVQFSPKDYTNRNYINVGGEKHLVTIPITYRFGDPINKVEISYVKDWQRKLLATLKMNYGKAEHFKDGYSLITDAFSLRFRYLCEMNIWLIEEIAKKFGFGCRIVLASKDVPTNLTKNDRNIYQCEALGGTVYYSGLGGKTYNDEDAYKQHGIELEYSDYTPVVYRQCWHKPFIENLSVLDYIFNCGYQVPEGWISK